MANVNASAAMLCEAICIRLMPVLEEGDIDDWSRAQIAGTVRTLKEAAAVLTAALPAGAGCLPEIEDR